ncbi:MAG: hypothetical protein MJE68_08590, partial [Proteobacteria bacterium]|nr:hypothetical protein [Pseudomonadota bacterium]
QQSKKIEAIYFCIVLVLMEIHAGGNQGAGDEKQLIDFKRGHAHYGLRLGYIDIEPNHSTRTVKLWLW